MLKNCNDLNEDKSEWETLLSTLTIIVSLFLFANIKL